MGINNNLDCNEVKFNKSTKTKTKTKPEKQEENTLL